MEMAFKWEFPLRPLAYSSVALPLQLGTRGGFCPQNIKSVAGTDSDNNRLHYKTICMKPGTIKLDEDCIIYICNKYTLKLS